MFCKYCGNRLEAGVAICPKCGCLDDEFGQETVFVDFDENTTAGSAGEGKRVEVKEPPKSTGLLGALAKVFSIVGFVLSGVTLLCGAVFLLMIISGMAIGGGGGFILAIYSIFGLVGMVMSSFPSLVAGITALVLRHQAAIRGQRVGAMPIVAFVLCVIAFICGGGLYSVLVFLG
jgi:hypothetical protein